MANTDTPLGLVPIKDKNGAPYNGAVTAYYLRSDYATAMFVGDPVIITGTANLLEYKGNMPGTLPTINKATAAGSSYISGVIVGFNPLPTDLTKTYNEASTERIAYVADDPDLVFEIQEESDAAAELAATSVGLNASLVYTDSGSTTSGKSGAELDTGTIHTNALQLKILRLVNRVDNAIGVNAKWEVMINLHTQRYTTGI